MITIAIQSHNFHLRLSWMLASLIANKIRPIVHISFLTGDTRTAAVIKRYRSNGLIINTKSYTDIESLQYRGLTRNRALRHCRTNWLLFADSDHVYHSLFFTKLHQYIDKQNLQTFDGILAAGRVSQVDHHETDRMIDDYPNYINNPFKKAFDRLSLVRRRNVGAGYFQLINVNHCPHGNYYVDPKKCRDWSWTTRYQNARSDGQFRRRIGKTHKLPEWFTLNQIHLNHQRDNQVGYHLEIAR